MDNVNLRNLAADLESAAIRNSRMSAQLAGGLFGRPTDTPALGKEVAPPDIRASLERALHILGLSNAELEAVCEGAGLTDQNVSKIDHIGRTARF